MGIISSSAEFLRLAKFIQAPPGRELMGGNLGEFRVILGIINAWRHRDAQRPDAEDLIYHLKPGTVVSVKEPA